MNTDARRANVLELIKHQTVPISATTLASQLNVSRQVIVGDVALIRAQGHDIIATPRGYIFPRMGEANQYVGKIVCSHSLDNMVDELYTIIDLGAIIINVIVEHDLYGEITGSLNLASRIDADDFIKKAKSSEVRLLSELTSGVHTHTISCRSQEHFEMVHKALSARGITV